MYHCVYVGSEPFPVLQQSSVTQYDLKAHQMILKIIDYLMAFLVDGLVSVNYAVTSCRKYGRG